MPSVVQALAAVTLTLALVAPAHAAALNLTEADAGKNFQLRVGDQVELRLSETASTGYVWTEQSNGAPALQALGKSSDYSAAAMPGAPGAAIFRYRAQAEGAAVVSLKLARDWEPAPVKEFSLRFDVRP
ncbi:putative secreted protein [Rhodoblastus acidophilus]|uniref:protease inhibitor I42 family protein n=1 Tax=Rhodoblastus acidophilus TaxID=1074 RepID=UPI002224D443|nr:protease inhibitor I42 family protein [Rhodoblastus acidophilus]MCW2284872.1 putative secreted protein [Rhodoblastus acidophilus]MCW2333838.1 putative secreted protein [Rhodoblastus acidophilus]